MEKLAHDAVNYGPGHGPDGDHCAVCANFQPGNPPHCRIVQDPIQASMWCEEFEPAAAGVMAPGGY